MLLPTDISCGYCDCSEFGSLERSPRRSLTRFELEFYLEDGKITYADDKAYPIHRNYVLIARPGQLRNSLLPFRTAYLKFFAEGDLARQLTEAPPYFPNTHPQEICERIDQILLYQETGRELMVQSHVLAVIDLVLQMSQQIASARTAPWIPAARQFIETHAAEPIRLREMAASVHLSPVYFHNVFTDSCGLTPHDYLIQCRVGNAKKLLWNSDKTIREIGDVTGFGCQQYFTKVFKLQTGMTPAAYRKSFQQNYLR